LPMPRETASVASGARMAKRSQCRASQRAWMPDASVRRRGVGNHEAQPQRSRTQAPPSRSRRRESQTRHAFHRAGPTAHAVGLPQAPEAPNRTDPPCDERGVAHAPGDGVSGERSQDGEAKPMPSEPKGMDARRERPATGCGQPRSVPPHKRPQAHPSRSRRRDGQTRHAFHRVDPTTHAVGLPRAPEACVNLRVDTTPRWSR